MNVVEITPADSIQANLDAIANAGGGELLLGVGEYKVAETIRIPECVAIRGVGNQCHVYPEKAQVRIVHLPRVESDLFRCDVRSPAPISGLCCVGSALSKSGMWFEGCSTIRVSNVALHGFTDGVVVKSCICSVFDTLYAECRYTKGSIPFRIMAGGSPTTTLVLRNCRLRRGEYGLLSHENALHDILLDSPVFESCVSGAVNIATAKTVRIVNPYWEECGPTSVATGVGVPVSIT